MPKGVFIRKPRSEEHKRNLSLSHLGKPSWNKGLKMSEETRRRISASKSGERHPMFGKHHSEETKLRMSVPRPGSGRRPGFKMSEETKMKLSLVKTGKLSGDKHWNWKGGITPVNKVIRGSIEYKLWRKSVFERDDYTCIWCKKRGVALQADHIKPFAYFPELRFAIDNGRTLCLPCHKTTDSYFNKSRWKKK